MCRSSLPGHRLGKRGPQNARARLRGEWLGFKAMAGFLSDGSGLMTSPEGRPHRRRPWRRRSGGERGGGPRAVPRRRTRGRGARWCRSCGTACAWAAPLRPSCHPTATNAAASSALAQCPTWRGAPAARRQAIHPRVAPTAIWSVH